MDQDDNKSESEEITEQINPNILHKKGPCTVIVGDSAVKHLHGKSIANKTNIDNVILVKPFSEARTKAMKHYVSPNLEKKIDLVILHTSTNDLKSVSLPEEITNEIISLALYAKKMASRLQFRGLFPEEIDSPKKLRMLTNVWKYSVKVTF